MAVAQKTARQTINDHIKSRGGSYSEWYVGIASEPRHRLFVEHNVDETNDKWIYHRCQSSAEARQVEEFFLNNLGTDGGPGGGDQATKYVYAYRKTRSTKE